MKKKPTRPGAGRRPSHGIWDTLRGPGAKGHRLPAHVTGEDDWEVEVPQIRMSRAFVVMLLLHLVAIGGLFAFHMFGRDDHDRERASAVAANAKAKPPVPQAIAAAPAPAAPAPEETAARNAAALATNTQVPPAAAETESDVPKAKPIPEDAPEDTATGHYVQHALRKGDSKELIASTYGITVKELVAANPRATFLAGSAVVVPQFGKTITTPDVEQRIPGADVELMEPSNTEYAARRSFAPNEDGVPEHEVASATPVLTAHQGNTPEPEIDSAPLRAATGRESSTRQVSARVDQNREVRQAERRSETAKAEKPERSEKAEKVAKAEKPEKTSKPSAGSRTHVVKKGDTVYNIARRYSISANDVMRANGVNDTAHIQLGQVLQIPVRR